MAFITKFALTKGLIEIEDDKVSPDGTYMHNPSGKAGWGTYVSKGHVHSTREKAAAKAEKMRTAKVVSHETAIAALRAIEF